MYPIQDLTFTRVFQGRDGIFASAKFRDWCQEFTFFLQYNGTIKGKSNCETWLELSPESSALVREKVRGFLRGCSYSTAS